jgi:hypothetical protein
MSPLPGRRGSTNGLLCALLVVYGLGAIGQFHLVFGRDLDERGGVYALGFHFGPLIRALVEKGEYRTEWPYGTRAAHRMPLLPLTLAALAHVSPSTLLANTVKTTLSCVAIGLAFARLRRRLRHLPDPLFLGLLAFALFSPPLWYYASALSYEEVYVVPLLCVLFVGLLTLRSAPGRAEILGLAAANALLYLTKEGTLVACAAFCALFLAATRSWRKGLVFSVPLAAAVLLWGLHTHTATGRWSPGTSMLGNNLFKGHNARTLDLYPADNLDKLAYDHPLVLRDEWEISDWYLARAVHHVRRDPLAALHRTLAKAWVCLVEVRKVPFAATIGFESRAQVLLAGAILLWAVPFRALFAATLGAAAWLALRRPALRRELAFPVLGFLVLEATFLAPFLAGFAYTRHLVPLILPTVALGMVVADRLVEARSADPDRRTREGLC